MTNKLMQTLLVCLVLGASASLVAAQTTADTNQTGTQPATPAASSVPAQAGSNIDENFELNIDLRRITERDYEASTAIEIGDTGGRGVNLQVGVAVAASQIDVLLRNIRGRVRFRATLEPVLQRINSRRAATTVNATGNTPE